jgi:hypothetical protein
MREVDGGAEAYSTYREGLPSNPDFFPIGIWLESVIEPTDAVVDRAMGLNTYVDLTPNSDLTLAEKNNMDYLTSWPAKGHSGRVLGDEPDMWAGAGASSWTGRYPGDGTICSSGKTDCGYSVQKQLRKGLGEDTMTYANYGKGVTFWLGDQAASEFVNEFQDVVSADNYWFTDPNICGATEGGTKLADPRDLTPDECRLGANYGWTVDRVRGLVEPRGSKPVWAFVEVGHPFAVDSAPTITAEQIKSAVWSSIVHGARGIIYFNHSFAGDCPTQHVLRFCSQQLREDVGAINQQIAQLAPALNAPFADGLLSTDGDVDAAVKVYQGDLYVFAGATRTGSQRVKFDVPCLKPGAAEVIGEERSVEVLDETFEDDFVSADAVHLYRFAGNACGL